MSLIALEKTSLLGKKTLYNEGYNPGLLCAIARAGKRQEIGIDPLCLPFSGFDAWTHYEVSWLNAKGKPQVGIAEISYDCLSPNIVESKSLKLYFNSLNNEKFNSLEAIEKIVIQDLSTCIQAPVAVTISCLKSFHSTLSPCFAGESLDTLDVACSIYSVEPSYLSVSDEIVDEILYSDLLKSNCLVTNQPDWGSVQISYGGKKINREGLLQYIVSYRNHNEFHEQCIERLFIDILNHCSPEKLTVYGRIPDVGAWILILIAAQKKMQL